MNRTEWKEQLERLRQKACWIVDFLPEQVPRDGGGQFFRVEWYLLSIDTDSRMRERLTAVLLKLLCYYPTVLHWNGWHSQPEPQRVAEAVRELMENHSGQLELLLPQQEALVVLDSDCLNLEVYGPGEQLQRRMAALAVSEGLFWRRALE